MPKKFRFLVNGQRIAEYPFRIKHLGHNGEHLFFLRLREINLVERGDNPPELLPGYLQFLTVSVHGGQASATFFIGSRGFEFMFQERFPFFSFRPFNSETNYDIVERTE